jgi:hypothetical protein
MRVGLRGSSFSFVQLISLCFVEGVKPASYHLHKRGRCNWEKHLGPRWHGFFCAQRYGEERQGRERQGRQGWRLQGLESVVDGDLFAHVQQLQPGELQKVAGHVEQQLHRLLQLEKMGTAECCHLPPNEGLESCVGQTHSPVRFEPLLFS